jgi:RND family efflux transporter MFP subunit
MGINRTSTMTADRADLPAGGACLPAARPLAASAWPPRRLARAAGATVLAAAWALATAPAAQAAEPATGPRVPTLEVRAGTGSTGFELDGVIQPIRQATVSAQVSGNLTELRIKAGDRVRTGQAIARIDERDVQAGLARTEAAVTEADAQVRLATTEFNRARELRGQGFLSQAAQDTAETQLKAARSALAQAQAARTQATLARGFAVVTAPFDAVVLETHMEAGDLATLGRPIATLYAPQALRAVVQVSTTRAPTARAARRIEVQLADGRWIAPAQRSEGPVADAVSQTVEWRLDLPSTAQAAVRPGQSVRVRFAEAAPGGAAAPDQPSVPRVPAAAVLRRGELTAVYVVQQQHFALRAVRAGASSSAGVEILAGLRTGERIAADAVKAGLSGAVPVLQADASPAQADSAASPAVARQ